MVLFIQRGGDYTRLGGNFPWSMGHHFREYLRKKTILWWILKCLSVISVPFDFSSWISRFFCWMVRIWKLNNFWIFRELNNKISVPLPLFQKFQNAWLNGKHPQYSWSSCVLFPASSHLPPQLMFNMVWYGYQMVPFKSACKIWPQLKLLAKIWWELTRFCLQNFHNCLHAQILECTRLLEISWILLCSCINQLWFDWNKEVETFLPLSLSVNSSTQPFEPAVCTIIGKSGRCSRGKFDHCLYSQKCMLSSHACKCSQRPFNTPIHSPPFLVLYTVSPHFQKS